MKFHDGTDCDAEAVKWNFDDMIKRGKKSWVYVYFNQMDSAEVVDKTTVKVKMKEPAALLPALAGYFGGVPIGSPTAVEKHGDELEPQPSGHRSRSPMISTTTGPMNASCLKKNPNYFKKDQAGRGLTLPRHHPD